MNTQRAPPAETSKPSPAARAEAEKKRCEKCNGMGWAKCSLCGGTGVISPSNGLGVDMDEGISQGCPTCEGEGMFRCDACSGRGRV
eukprot:tig00020995_g16915.t1